MNLQQLRYLVATADEGTMTRAAEALHVAQPALSRAVRGLEGEIGVTVFERMGRGVGITRDGREVVAIARRILSEVDRLGTIGERQVLRVCAIGGQAREIGSPVIARFVTGAHGRAALDVVDTADEVIDRVRDGRASLGIVDLPAPRDLQVVSLGWQEIVLLHPPDWSIDDPLDLRDLSGLPLLSPGTDDWRHAAIEDNLRAYGIDPTIAAEVTERDLLTGLVQQGAGAWFSYGRRAEDAVTGGAGMVHLDPPVVREVGVVSMGEPGDAGRNFIDLARAETQATLLPVGDPILERAAWIKGSEVLATPPPPASARPTPPLTP
jgi:DNA-binding transcriptional LysR family regulator